MVGSHGILGWSVMKITDAAVENAELVAVE
jgi:hypothetical protein